eukprot:CAMPEP_0197863514 /NCGR_PEP_ID=MMETSP1438-20131217/41018_1 /TAXON_ID=1461541 /ORGANISM="Pterosperma sp., Strain CCMP1384" /LENGTH=105 /DNA_ID=CAMNT_0043481435 /DNA_START=323 /DNA_END=640 /DNA_ORIENTATION=+
MDASTAPTVASSSSSSIGSSELYDESESGIESTSSSFPPLLVLLPSLGVLPAAASPSVPSLPFSSPSLPPLPFSFSLSCFPPPPPPMLLFPPGLLLSGPSSFPSS